MTGSYDYRLVLLSIVMVFIASLAAFMFIARVAHNQGNMARAWLALGAITMGSGIWAMHFISMLAWSLPTPMGYMLDETALSWLIAVSVSWLALDIASRPGLSSQILIASGVVMGLGIGGMHYTGMHAMQMFPEITYNKPLFALSIVVAISASIIALYFMFLASNHHRTINSRVLAAVIMSIGIAGTHFTGMAATQIAPNAICINATAFDPSLFAIMIALGTSTLILLATILAMMDARNDDHTNWLMADTQNKLSRMDMLDSLTQLPNQHYFQQHLDIGIRRSARLSNALAIAIIRLDNLKSVRKTLGQHISDEILRTAAKRLQETIRGCDMVAYNGNEEFLVLFEDITDEYDIMPVMERIMESLNASFRIDKHDITLNVRAGISLYPKHGNAERLLTYAEAAMHRVQPDDMHGFRVFDDKLETLSFDLLETQQELRHAIARNEMAVYIEPRTDLSCNTITSLEIQIRWQHPVKGTIPLATFGPMAERIGIADDMTDWILEQSARTINEMREQHFHLPVFLPLVSAQMRLPGIEERVRNMLKQFGLPADALTLEVAESTFMQQPEYYVDLFKRMPAVSLKISLENFGTRFSCLPYLQYLKLQQIKLDRSFTSELIGSPKSRAIAGAIIELAHANNLDVVTENVSNTDERNALLALECNQIQGFLCANPVHQDQLIKFLSNSNLQAKPETTTTSIDEPSNWAADSMILSPLHS